MLPSQTQRVLMGLAVALPLLLWAGLGPGWLGGTLGWGLAMVLALLVAAGGNPLSAVGVLAVLAATHWGTNPQATLEHVITNASEAGVSGRPGLAGLLPLMTQTFAATLLAWATLWMLDLLRPRVRDRLPLRLRSGSLGESHRLAGTTREACLTALLTAAGAGGLLWVLVQDGRPPQTLGGAFLAFAIAGVLGQALRPSRALLPLLLCPALTAAAAYCYALWRWPTEPELLASLYRGQGPGSVLVQPVQYLTAGVAGMVLALGLGQMLEDARLAETPPSDRPAPASL